MQSVKQISHITVRLGEDFNWWQAPTPDEPDAPLAEHGVLDPRQVRDLVERLVEYRPHGLDPQSFAHAFRLYTVDAEIAEGILRLEAGHDGEEMFALPVIDEDGDGPYFDFLDALAAARVHLLNTDHHRCTVDDLRNELDALDQDRYFNANTMHAFDEIDEILQWSPAEWDQP